MQQTDTKEVHSDATRLESFNDTAALASPGHDGSPAERQISRKSLVVLIIGLGMAVFCVALDNTILATAIPKISQDFKAIEDIGWYGSAYFLTTCAVTLLFGRLYTFYSLKWVFLVAVGLFELGSLVCGTAPTSMGLIIGRAVAGLGSAGILPGAILMITHNVPLHRRALFNALIMAMASVAGVLGPLIGGALTEHATWRWCFYINLPMGAITVLTVFFFFRDPPISATRRLSTREKIQSLDILGLALFICAICCLVIGLEWGGSKYAWNSARIIVLFVVCVVLLIAWTWVQHWKQEKATIPPRLAVMRDVWAAGLYSLLFSGAYYGMTYYFPIWLQSVKGASPAKSGIMNLPMIIAITVCSLLAGVLVHGIGYYTPIMIVGSILLTIGCGMCSTLKPDSGSPKWIGYQALLGIGAGLGYNLPLMAIQTAIPSEDVATGTAIVIFGQNLSSTLFIAIAQNVFQSLLVSNVRQFVPSLDPREVAAAGAADLSKSFSGDVLPSLRLAYNMAVTQTFYISVAGAGLSLFGVAFISWLSVKRVKGDTVAFSH
ncbi:Major facilitator superfamily domain, general substrate transporter [Penicillium italicum]|uniref:Major facilitator superfamily domain, general substrate transporter n=1 Tax=Penicillium italicum TaxID=40296 RepID=A0A0A2LB87_PENIT|nr:Major facilitator superfamily domain, general substrate transporter [Penicillium italicum]